MGTTMDLANNREIARVANPRALVATARIVRDTGGDWEVADTLVAAACTIERQRAEVARLRLVLAALGVAT